MGRSASGGKTPSGQASLGVWLDEPYSLGNLTKGGCQCRAARVIPGRKKFGLHQLRALQLFANVRLLAACKPCLGGTPRRDVKLDERTSHAPVRKKQQAWKACSPFVRGLWSQLLWPERKTQLLEVAPAESEKKVSTASLA